MILIQLNCTNTVIYCTLLIAVPLNFHMGKQAVVLGCDGIGIPVIASFFLSFFEKILVGAITPAP